MGESREFIGLKTPGSQVTSSNQEVTAMHRNILSILTICSALALSQSVLAQSFASTNDVASILSEGIQICGLETQLRLSQNGAEALYNINALNPEMPSGAKLATIDQLSAALVMPGADICLSQYIHDARQTALAAE